MAGLHPVLDLWVALQAMRVRVGKYQASAVTGAVRSTRCLQPWVSELLCRRSGRANSFSQRILPCQAVKKLYGRSGRAKSAGQRILPCQAVKKLYRRSGRANSFS